MTIQVTGKNIEAGDAFQNYASEKISVVLNKYLGREADSHVRLEKERGIFRTTCSVRLASGLLLEATGEGGDAYSSVDDAVHTLETRVRRHKERLKGHSAANGSARKKANFEARDYVVSVADDEMEEPEKGHPLIIAENNRSIGEMTVGEAVMQLDVTEAHFMLFRNAAHGGLNIVYRRPDGNIGWVDAQSQADGKAKSAGA